MVSADTQKEIEQYLGQVPSWIDALAPSASDHAVREVGAVEGGRQTLARLAAYVEGEDA